MDKQEKIMCSTSLYDPIHKDTDENEKKVNEKGFRYGLDYGIHSVSSAGLIERINDKSSMQMTSLMG